MLTFACAVRTHVNMSGRHSSMMMSRRVIRANSPAVAASASSLSSPSPLTHTAKAQSGKREIDPIAALILQLYQTDPLLPRTALQVRVEPTLSVPGQPLQYGVYACVDIPSGTAVCWYGGEVMHKSDVDRSLGVSHVRSMGGDYVLNGNVFASQLPRGGEGASPPPTPPESGEEGASTHPTPPERGVVGGAAPSDFVFRWGTDGPETLLPIGFMCNTSGTQTGNNVRIRRKRILDLLDVPYLQATTNISRGTQILCNYGNLHSKSHTDAFVPL